MASTYSNSLVLELMETGANANTWGNNTNTNLETVDAFTAGYLSKSVAGSTNVTLTTSATTSPTVESANKVLDLNGTLTGNITVFVPQKENNYLVYNNTSGSFTLDVAATGGTGVQIDQGTYEWVYCDGTNVLKADLGTTNASQISSGTLADARLSANVVFANGATTITGDQAFSANITVTGTSTLTGDVTASGNVNVSTNVTVTGTMTAGTVVETSSIAYKENIRSLDSTTEAILSMDPVVYDRKDGSQKNEVGLIAEEVYKIAPELVHLKDGNPDGIKYTKLAVYLLHAIKDLKKDLDMIKGSR